ncbi:NrfD/PsrC family molybdoenzyme membrane anchor subunit [uncultured Chloroflexus sp.]|uniref:NrfD/PsrC family molybdoenzyme membrane anchor subunit n=1 Tax=uncultured Chloroflexus sp. TaxID=214040 RepID=UPI002607ECBC|nr:NrfD/PsrC family molybdoenzyme membrane anchor subunit [uncultured Chloroflexus sp.]
MLKRLLYVVGSLGLLIGMWGLYDRFVYGHMNANYGSYVVWGLWVALYMFFAGVATGGFMLATLDLLFELPLFRGSGRMALWGSLVTLPAGLAAIGLDLGHMTRIWKVYLQPNFGAVMAQLVWGYTIFLIIIIVSLWLSFRPQPSRWLKPIMVVGLVLAIFLSGGIGALLGVNQNRVSWHVSNLPAQFPVFNLTSGVALMLIAIGWFGPVHDPRRSQQLHVLGLGLVVLLLVKGYYLWTDVSQALYQNSSHGAEAINLVLFGPYGWAFWLLQIGLGMLLPLIVLTTPIRNNGFAAGLMGVCVLLGLAVARANIIFPALSLPELRGLGEAFHGPHLSFTYSPSLMEWAVTAGIVGAATIGFVIGADRLPLFSRPVKSAGAAD